ncbi:MBL fold metallo-hydrolase [Microbulbifer sp. OS29]|uniref:Linear primary-alkylsulfatase n=1 Tax=Microbulbifer okhotskensis TaxID=2926617 RepID=A0A9X2EMR3_9GAMM|nr:alkyl sulfatase dimerization domain-containing protein [Microbulbifer okhotskensis]MCO1335137.1 MBL fold metallo-hydrolase [Microbulbifer okhotskensis]
MRSLILMSLLSFLLIACGSEPETDREVLNTEIKPASNATTSHNRALSKQLPFHDETDFQLAKRGFIASIPGAQVNNAEGRQVYGLSQLQFLQGGFRDTVNPSLWRQAQLNALNNGLFKVVDGLYQVRSLDLANMTLVQGKKGWIIIDPLTSAETAAAALALANKALGERPVSAVIFTHSHADHFAGVAGVLSKEQLSSGSVDIIAPQGFSEEAISENVRSGNVMQRRALYQFGDLLPSSPEGFVSSGLGNRVSDGEHGIATPTVVISEAGAEMTVDGVEIIFINTPGAEAPTEMVFFFPQLKALCMSEIANHTLHNIYTLRGAKTRDAQAWSRYIEYAMEKFGDQTEVVLSSHHWPTWGKSEAMDYLAKQRDLYKYIHDQTLRLANHGYDMVEIAERLELPESLSQAWANRGYYGTVNVGAKAVYNRYLGYFDGNPANLHPVPQEEAAERYVEYMGGDEAIMLRARQDFARGNYRWVAMVLKHLVFAEPENKPARYLLADSLEQLGYQAESGIWRNFYLSGAKELRHGVQFREEVLPAEDIVARVPLQLLFDAMAVRLNGEKAADAEIRLNIDMIDTEQKYLVVVQNGVLHGYPGRHSDDPSAGLALSSTDLRLMFGGLVGAPTMIKEGRLKVSGNPLALIKFGRLFDKFDRNFNLVTP